MSSITSLDLFFLQKELRKNLRDGFFRKIYQQGSAKDKRFLFEIYTKGVGSFWLYADDEKLFMTKEKTGTPQEPPSFCMFLRKYLLNKRIRDVRQVGFDRIIEITTDDHILIIELVSPGNVILCDSSYTIIMPLEIQKWKDRTVKSKEKYRHPPRGLHPFRIDFDDFRYVIRKNDRKLVAVLATTLGLGSVYAKEVCVRAAVDGQKNAQDVSTGEFVKLHEALVSLTEGEVKPTVYKEFATPFPLKSVPESGTHHNSFSEALEEFFSEQIHPELREQEEKVEEEKGRIERVLEKHEESRKKWTGKVEEDRGKAETIFEHYTTVQAVLNGLRKAKKMGLSWKEIKEKISLEQTPEAETIKEVREEDAIVVLVLGGKEIEIDFRKSIEENAADYYEDAKKVKKKMAGLEVSEQEQRKKLEEVSVVVPEEKPVVKVKKKRGHWYDKFRWFFSSEDILVVGGKTATLNENLIKRRTDPKDKVLHADIPGSAFVVIKSKGEEIPDHTRREAAEFAAAHSKAWSVGRGKVDVFCVNPDQVSKNPPSGGYLSKGSFMIYGEREWYRDTELKLAIGVKIDREEGEVKVISGPVIAINKHAKYFVTIKPGYMRSVELAKLIKKKILIKTVPEDKYLIEHITLDEFQNLIPAGVGEVVDIGI